MTDYPIASYVTPDEAETFWANRPDGESASWIALDDSDIQLQYLIQATSKIDALPLRGVRYEPKWIIDGLQKDINNDGIIQILEFPRFIDGVIVEWDLGTGPTGCTGFPIIPQLVKDACCWEALALVQFAGDVDNADRANMKNQGVLSYNIGGAYSESLGKSHEEKFGLHSPEALQLMRRYIDRRPTVT